MRILELTNFSAGGCGVFARVKSESELLSRNHEVRIFSSNFIKGSIKKASQFEQVSNLKIQRFKAIKLGGESFMYWNFTNKAIDFKPDIIIAHGYRHLHTTQALSVGKKLKVPVVLVTHAPFVEGDSTRSLPEKLAVRLYDRFIGSRILNNFSKIAIIAHWEKDYLKKLNIDYNKLVYLPNGISPDYFKGNPQSKNDDILFLGRISPIKDIGTLIKSVSLLNNKKVKLYLAGPIEEKYGNDLKNIVNERQLKERVSFLGPVYDLTDKIKLIDKFKTFILPSLKEGMPQALIEAMARQRTVISSNNQGCRAIIRHKLNGYLFKIGDAEDLAKKIEMAFKEDSQEIREKARTSVKEYLWPAIIIKIENLIKNLVKNK